jgi:hypothetical protein
VKLILYLVGAGDVVDPQRVIVGQRVGHISRQGAREVLIAVFADIAERRRDAVRRRCGRHRPDLAIERIGAAMERVGAIVSDQIVGLTIQGELRTADAVGVTTG